MPGPSTCMCSRSRSVGSPYSTWRTIPAFQENVGGHGCLGRSAIVTSSSNMYPSTGGCPTVASESRDASAFDNPWTEKSCTPTSGMYSPWSVVNTSHMNLSLKLHSITVLLRYQLSNRPLGQLLYMQTELNSTPHGVGRVTFEEIKLACGSALGWF